VVRGPTCCKCDGRCRRSSGWRRRTSRCPCFRPRKRTVEALKVFLKIFTFKKIYYWDNWDILYMSQYKSNIQCTVSQFCTTELLCVSLHKNLTPWRDLNTDPVRDWSSWIIIGRVVFKKNKLNIPCSRDFLIARLCLMWNFLSIKNLSCSFLRWQEWWCKIFCCCMYFCRHGVVPMCAEVRVRLQNRRSRVRIPPGFKVLGLYTLQCCCLHKLNMHCHCVHFRKKWLDAGSRNDFSPHNFSPKGFLPKQLFPQSGTQLC
jgi:hypothetical protein